MPSQIKNVNFLFYFWIYIYIYKLIYSLYVYSKDCDKLQADLVSYVRQAIN